MAPLPAFGETRESPTSTVDLEVGSMDWHERDGGARRGRMKAFQAIAEEVTALGVQDVFTFTAEDIVDLVAELSQRGVRVWHTRHEHTAIGMADGYARVSGKVGVAIVGAGVGLTNAINALLTASKAHSNVVVLAGEVPGVTARLPASSESMSTSAGSSARSASGTLTSRFRRCDCR